MRATLYQSRVMTNRRKGAPVLVIGQLQADNTTIVLSNASSITLAPQPGQSQAWLKAPLKGKYRVLIILTKFDNMGSTSVSEATMEKYLSTLTTFFERCSYGVVQLDPTGLAPVPLGDYEGDGSCINRHAGMVNEWFGMAMDNVRIHDDDIVATHE